MDIRNKARNDLVATILCGVDHCYEEEIYELVTEWMSKWMCVIQATQMFSNHELELLRHKDFKNERLDHYMKGEIAKILTSNECFFHKDAIITKHFEQHYLSFCAIREPEEEE